MLGVAQRVSWGAGRAAKKRWSAVQAGWASLALLAAGGDALRAQGRAVASVRRRVVRGASDASRGQQPELCDYFVTAAPSRWAGASLAGSMAAADRKAGRHRARRTRRLSDPQGSRVSCQRLRQGSWRGRKGGAGRAGPRRGPRPRGRVNKDQYKQVRLFWF